MPNLPSRLIRSKYIIWAMFIAFIVGMAGVVWSIEESQDAMHAADRYRAEQIAQLEETQAQIKKSQLISCERGNDLRRSLRRVLIGARNNWVPSDASESTVLFYREALVLVAPVPCEDVTP